MLPTYGGYMDPQFTRCRDQTPYQYYQLPHPMTAGPFAQPSPFQPWPHHGSSGYPNQADLNSRCNHQHPPTYYSLRPLYYPCPHELPPPHPYYPGPYPPYPGAYPAYSFLPPYMSIDHVKNDDDKVIGHCCGCPNHICHRGDDSQVTIEEIKPDEQKNGNSGLLCSPNYPYPVVWVPESYMKDNDSHKSSEVHPKAWNGWVPLDISTLKGLKQGDDKKQPESQQKTAPPLSPMFWMPGNDKPEDAMKSFRKLITNPKDSEEVPTSKIKIIPLKYLENGDHEKKDEVGNRSGGVDGKPSTEDKSGGSGAMTSKAVTTRTIPVVQKKDIPEKVSLKDKQIERRDEEDLSQKKGDKGTKGKEELSQSKPLKLPPVCLRVDPLPRKKTTNGSPKSLSPPSHKDEDEAHDDSKNELQNHKSQDKEGSKKDIRVVHVDNHTERGGQCSQETIPNTFVKGKSDKAIVDKVNGNIDDQKANAADMQRKDIEVTAADKQMAEENMARKEVTGGKRTQGVHLSESDAALHIQSAYRGYDVRRWQPLEKLRKITQVREQAQHVRRQLQSLQDSAKQLEAKEGLAIGETIMNLLLQLDTVQGLHPSVREARKSVARDLIFLQEQLDSLSKQSPSEQESAKVSELKNNGNEEASMQETSAVSEAVSEQDCSLSSDMQYDTESPSLVKGEDGPVSRKDAQLPIEAEAQHSAPEDSTEPEQSFFSDVHEEANGSPAADIPLNSELVSQDIPLALDQTSVSSNDVSGFQNEPLASLREALEEKTEAVSMVQDSMSRSGETTVIQELGRTTDVTLAEPTNPDEFTTTIGNSSAVDAQADTKESLVPSYKSDNVEETAVISSETQLQSDEACLDVMESKIGNENITALSQNAATATKQEKQRSLLDDILDSETNKTGACTELEDVDASHSDEAERPEKLELQAMAVNPTVVQNSAPHFEIPSSVHQQCIDDGGTNTVIESAEVVDVMPEESKDYAEEPIQEKAEEGFACEKSVLLDGLNSTENLIVEEKKLMEENAKLREVLQKLLGEGKDQVEVITTLSDRVKDLERRLAHRKRPRVKMNRPKRNKALCKV